MTNPWDQLAEVFAVYDDESADVADNILVAWPSLLRCIQTANINIDNSYVIDFGCGGGQFANYLQGLGAQIVGIDSSGKMIERARNHYGDAVQLIHGGYEQLPADGNIDLVVSVMVLQFIDDLVPVAKAIAASLRDGGLFAFAVHNPRWIDEWIKRDQVFTDPTTNSNGSLTSTLHLRDQEMPTNIREIEDFDRVFEPFGFNRVFHDEPAFSEEFLARFPSYRPSDCSEYLVLGYELTNRSFL